MPLYFLGVCLKLEANKPADTTYASMDQQRILPSQTEKVKHEMHQIPDSKLRWPHIGPTWILSAPRWAKVDPTCFAIWDISIRNTKCSFCRYMDVNLQIHACLHNFFMPKIYFRVKADFNEGQFTEVSIRNNCLAYDIDISCINESIFIFKSEPQYLVGFGIILKQTYYPILPISRMLISSNLSGNPLKVFFIYKVVRDIFYVWHWTSSILYNAHHSSFNMRFMTLDATFISYRFWSKLCIPEFHIHAD